MENNIRQLSTSIREPRSINSTELQEMFALFSMYYDSVDFKSFLTDLNVSDQASTYYRGKCRKNKIDASKNRRQEYER